MTTILELNDADLTLYLDGRPIYRAPGVAVLTGAGATFGEHALRLSRIYPRQANLQYFSRMSADPLGHPGPRARNHADLVYLHLQQLVGLVQEPILLAVPAIYSAEQLGVLLGILQEAALDVAGFVDSAVATACALSLPARAWHLDVLLQRAVLTELALDEHVTRRGVDEVIDCGLVRLLEGWVNAVADRFVHETRFDPLHSAATEQQLFNQIFDQVWSGSAERELAFELVQGEITRRVELGRQVLEERAAPRFRELAGRLPPGAHVLVTARSAALPGLLEAFREADLTVSLLRPEALSFGCEQCVANIIPAGGELRLVTRLPRRAPALPEAPARHDRATPAAATPGTDAVTGSAAPTHALNCHRAFPLGHGTLGFSVVRHGTVTLLRPAEGLTLNGTAIFRDTALEVGDRIGHDGRDYVVISVEG